MGGSAVLVTVKRAAIMVNAWVARVGILLVMAEMSVEYVGAIVTCAVVAIIAHNVWMVIRFLMEAVGRERLYL